MSYSACENDYVDEFQGRVNGYMYSGMDYPTFHEELENECKMIRIRDLLQLDRVLIKEQLNKMSLLSAVIVNLRFWQDYSLDDISKELGLAYETVEKIYLEALTDLRDFIELDDPDNKKSYAKGAMK